MSEGAGEPKVSIVVINFNGSENVLRAIDSILESDYSNYEIVVVDCLTEGLEDLIRERYGNKVKVVHFDSDIGASASHNVGAAYSSPDAKYLVFMDDDVVVSRDWLKRLVGVMEKDPRIGVVQAKILSMRDPKRMDHLGLALDILGTWFTAYGLPEGMFTRPLEIFAASSATMITRKDLYVEVGGFDPEYFIYDDDTDYGWRVRLLGYRVVFCPEAIVWHKGGLVGGLSFIKLYHGYKNRLTNLAKNLSIGNMLIQVPLTLCFGFLNMLILAVTARRRELCAYFLATLYFLVNLRRIFLKRSRVQTTRRISDSYLFKRGFIRRTIAATIIMFKMLVIEYIRCNPRLRSLYVKVFGREPRLPGRA